MTNSIMKVLVNSCSADLSSVLL